MANDNGFDKIKEEALKSMKRYIWQMYQRLQELPTEDQKKLLTSESKGESQSNYLDLSKIHTGHPLLYPDIQESKMNGLLPNFDTFEHHVLEQPNIFSTLTEGLSAHSPTFNELLTTDILADPPELTQEKIDKMDNITNKFDAVHSIYEAARKQNPENLTKAFEKVKNNSELKKSNMSLFRAFKNWFSHKLHGRNKTASNVIDNTKIFLDSFQKKHTEGTVKESSVSDDYTL
ncbi:hypothetical protein [Piscirickettsia salmonis]|uniref:hypothetical protein n=1 Tax=Piscirickettsia salmonis TaxID=1238 RepID=UPI0007C9153C|nr:hypothetical protein A0O36_02559 [Piscirickettsiaceae bacterium NZ-RLO1]